jgi:multiple sugar transport system substrate-binding protein
VIVDNINLGLIPLRAAAEISAQKGHDLMMFRTPPSVYEE